MLSSIWSDKLRHFRKFIKYINLLSNCNYKHDFIKIKEEYNFDSICMLFSCNCFLIKPTRCVCVSLPFVLILRIEISLSSSIIVKITINLYISVILIYFFNYYLICLLFVSITCHFVELYFSHFNHHKFQENLLYYTREEVL